jgi:hypothetical protein
MASKYPNELDGLPTDKANGTIAKDDHAENHNEANSAVNAVQAVLGIKPQGGSATVVARLGAIDALTQALIAAVTSGIKIRVVYLGEEAPERPELGIENYSVEWLGEAGPPDPEEADTWLCPGEGVFYFWGGAWRSVATGETKE